MKPFLDLTGASGATYRFRRVEALGELPATAGNFVLVNPAAELVGCGAVRSLLDAQRHWDRASADGSAPGLYIRLNVSRVVRNAEHADIVAGLPVKVLAAEDDA